MPPTEMCSVIAKFHYTGLTGPDRTGPDQTTRVSDKVRGLCLVGSGRARVVEFSYKEREWLTNPLSAERQADERRRNREVVYDWVDVNPEHQLVVGGYQLQSTIAAINQQHQHPASNISISL